MLVTISATNAVDSSRPIHSPQVISTYAGFAEINPIKNHFILVGDTQSTSHWEFWRERNDKERKLIVEEITRREPAFVVHLGDLTTRGSSKKHWEQFDNFHKEFREKKIPYFPILGNHDLSGSDRKALQNYFEHFPHLDEGRWYSFTWKNVAFVTVDSNFSTLAGEQNEQQTQWYLKEFERFERDEGVDYIIVCCHEPPFTNSKVVKPNKKCKAHFADPFIQLRKPGLFFSGHSHSYERFEIGGKYFIVSGGGGGPRHKVIVDSAKARYKDLFAGPELRFLHFCEIENREDALVFRVLRLELDGTFTVVDPFVIRR